MLVSPVTGMDRLSFAKLLFRSLGSFGFLGVSAVATWQLPLAWESSFEVAPGEVARDPVRNILEQAIVVVDAGHGGEDSGTMGHGVHEKDLALDLARRVERRLAASGVKVRMTRDSDRFVELDERSAIPERVGASVFVSLHLNASTATEVAGIETYFSSRRTTTDAGELRRRIGLTAGAEIEDHRSELLASMIQARACRATGAADREVRDSKLYVVLNSACPAVLVECGYLTNREEAQRLRQENYQERLAAAVADAVRRYLVATAFHPQRGMVFPAPSASSRDDSVAKSDRIHKISTD